MRVIETFGPTIQGEGPHAGRVCHFLRLGGCDYRCAWCDTMYAVEPELVRQAPDLDALEVVGLLGRLEPAPMVVISGGNPALWHLEELAGYLRRIYDCLAVETQGSVWRSWLNSVDSLVVSPKPPSSGMATPAHAAQTDQFMEHARSHRGAVLKVVVFDGQDLDWALAAHQRWPVLPFYLSAGTDQVEDPLVAVANRYAWLAEQVAARPELHAAVVLPQLHVVAWGSRVGV